MINKMDKSEKLDADLTKDDNVVESAACVSCCPTQTVDSCCDTKDVIFDACQDTKDFTIGGDRGLEVKCTARLLKIRVKFRNVCKGRKLAIGILVCEYEKGTLKPRGFKGAVIKIPDDGKKKKCCNIRVDQFCFVLPEESSICSPRSLRVKVIAHYADLESSQFCPC